MQLGRGSDARHNSVELVLHDRVVLHAPLPLNAGHEHLQHVYQSVRQLDQLALSQHSPARASASFGQIAPVCSLQSFLPGGSILVRWAPLHLAGPALSVHAQGR